MSFCFWVLMEREVETGVLCDTAEGDGWRRGFWVCFFLYMRIEMGVSLFGVLMRIGMEK